jgi:isopentenyl-diphosphate Delta-isomerase
LEEEMGFDCSLSEGFSLIYKAKLDNGYFEHEFDHVLFGKFNGVPSPTVEEVEDWRWIEIRQIERDLAKHRSNYTYWFAHSFLKVISLFQPGVRRNGWSSHG